MSGRKLRVKDKDYKAPPMVQDIKFRIGRTEMNQVIAKMKG